MIKKIVKDSNLRDGKSKKVKDEPPYGIARQNAVSRTSNRNEVSTGEGNQKLVRVLNKLSEIAKAIGVSKPTVSQYVSGRIQPSLSTLSKLCNFLNISADEILEIRP